MIDESDMALLRQGVNAAKQRACEQGSPVLASCSLPHPNIDFVQIFAANHRSEQPATLWAMPEDNFALLGLGCTHEFQCPAGRPWSDLQSAWETRIAKAVVIGDHRPVLCGGFAFDRRTRRSKLWRDFPAAALTLHRYFLQAEGTRIKLVLNTLVDGRSDCEKLCDELLKGWQKIVARSYSPPAEEVGRSLGTLVSGQAWRDKVSAAVEAIGAERLRKVVLARAEQIAVDVPLPDILDGLRQLHPGAYVFAFARGRSCFLGASPERLIARRGNRVHTCAVAGTAPRHHDPEIDRQLGRELLISDKNRYEHALVANELKRALGLYCDHVASPPEPRLRKLRHVQHLVTPIRGEIHSNMPLLALLQQLHPSPAVGGFPTNEAMAYIRAHEGMDRGWYAGPVGWLDAAGDGEFAVALRSALLAGRDAVLFAGCGIVKDSKPEDEYWESRYKMQAMMTALAATGTEPA
ncbi:hypothetical protein CAI21_12055 [Alkalilimnicola ehrlichii]|uniref:isochorismate synthase n=1 Tax=Alkalilimnicola ehrlichii TaxID=351052 RepID=A0A3E0WS02_9GAMM|nr:isochorismate synthase [Alkalilimnicola ehrlichii]RFA28587.1 hypothetical protein CAI21_12055 [Alkalilimnicola ehrlichii]RFA35752.1 hypothetical protein CAL65_12575 [Alkalilimnicola ehrlichii]